MTITEVRVPTLEAIMYWGTLAIVYIAIQQQGDFSHTNKDHNRMQGWMWRLSHTNDDISFNALLST